MDEAISCEYPGDVRQKLEPQNNAPLTDTPPEKKRDWKLPGVTFWMAPPSDVGKN